jgi:hypothetical protein
VTVETINGVLTDLVIITQRLPVDAERAEIVATVLDQLATELTEAATMPQPQSAAVPR